jgi:hypothetical protein
MTATVTPGNPRLPVRGPVTRITANGGATLSPTALEAGHRAGVLPVEDRLRLLRADYMDLLEAARSAVAAAWAGDEDPLGHLVALLGHRGQLPEVGASPVAVRSSARLPGVIA